MWVGTDYAGNDLGTSDYAIGAAGFLPFGKVVDKGIKYGGKTIGAIEKQGAAQASRLLKSKARNKLAAPTVKGAGKVADKVPTHVPKNWSKATIEDAISTYEHSVKLRKAEQAAFDAVGGRA